MSNLFLNLPVPAADGVGAAVDCSGMGAIRTITTAGDFGEGTLVIEFSNDGGVTFVPLTSYNTPKKRSMVVAAQFMRVRVANARFAVAANCDVACNDDGGLFANLPAPAANGVGAAVDVSALGTINTVTITGVFTGAVIVEVSEDNVTWNPWRAFNRVGHATGEVVAQFMRVRRAAVSSGAPGLPAVDIGAINDAAAGGGSGTTSTYIYQPGGGGTGPVVWDDFDDLMAAMDAERVANAPTPGGKFELQFDDSATTPVVVPANGPYNMDNVTWMGRLPANNALIPDIPVQVVITDGAVFQQLRKFRSNLQITYTPAGPEVFPVSDIVDGDLVEIRENVIIAVLGGVADYFFDCSGVVGGESCRFVLEEAVIGDGAHFTILGPSGAEPAGELQLILLDGAIVNDSAIEDGDHTVNVLGNSARIGPQSPSGTVTVNVSATERWNVRGPFAGPSVNAADYGDMMLCNPAADNVTVTLPEIDPYDEGLAIVVKSVDDAAAFNVIVTPFAGDTIDGAASYTITVARASITLVSDGSGNWNII